MRDRKHLVSAEVEKLLAATKGTRDEINAVAPDTPVFVL